MGAGKRWRRDVPIAALHKQVLVRSKLTAVRAHNARNDVADIVPHVSLLDAFEDWSTIEGRFHTGGGVLFVVFPDTLFEYL
jgi:hypothetical protein